MNFKPKSISIAVVAILGFGMICPLVTQSKSFSDRLLQPIAESAPWITLMTCNAQRSVTARTGVDIAIESTNPSTVWLGSAVVPMGKW